MEIKRVLPSRRDSYERLMHDSGQSRFLLELTKDEALRRRLLGATIGTLYWGDLSPRYRTVQPLRQHLPPSAI